LQKLKNLMTSCRNLANINDDTKLTDTQKETLDADARIKLISSVVDLSKIQLKNIKNRLDKIEFPKSDGWYFIKKDLSEKLDAYNNYFGEQYNELGKELAIDQIRSLAQKIKDKKNKEIDKFIERANRVAISFNTDNILRLSDQRIQKVGADIMKIYNKKLTNNPKIKDSFQKSVQKIELAHNLNDRAKWIMLNIYPAGKDIKKDFIDSIKNDVNPPTKNTKDQVKTITIGLNEIEGYLEKIIVSALENVSSAYDVLMEMSINAKQYLK
jgi:hypothetical protein